MATSLLVKRDLLSRPMQAFVLFGLITLAAALLHTSLMLLVNYSGNIDRKAAEFAAPNSAALVTDSSLVSVVDEHLADDATVSSFEITRTHAAAAAIELTGQELSAVVNIINLDEPVKMGKAVVITKSDASLTNPIYAPAVLEAANGFALGDPLTISTVRGDITFHIAGFIEELFGSSPGMGFLTFGLSGDEFTSFDQPGFAPANWVKVQSATPEGAANEFDGALSAAQSQASADNPIYSFWGTDLRMMKQAVQMSASVVVALFSGLAAAITIIAIVVTWFLLRNVITTDMVNIGALRAAGHTTTSIIGVLVLTQGALTALAALAGTGLSYAMLPTLNHSFRAQTGISWQPTFSWVSLAVTLAVLLSAVVLTATFVSLRVRKVTTVAALRGGIPTHSAATSRLPLATTNGPLPILLGLKAGLRQGVQNALVAFTAAIVGFSAVFALGMGQTLMGDQTKAAELLVGKIEDVFVQVRPDTDLEPMLAEIREMPHVTTARAQTFYGMLVGGTSVAFAITDDPETSTYDPVVEGRLPRHDNELAMGGKLAKLLGLKVGDTWRPDVGQGPADFVITGLTSSVRNMGQNVALSTTAYKRLEPNFRQNFIVVYTDGEIGQVIDSLKDRFGDELLAVNNQRENVESQLSGYLTMVPILGGFVGIFTVVVTVLVIGLVVASLLVRSRRELGVKKAMGFTNGQLATQIRWTYLPALAGGALLGVVAGTVGLGPLMTALLSGMGLMRVNVEHNWAMTLGIGFGMIALAWMMMSLLTLRIRRVSAYELVSV